MNTNSNDDMKQFLLILMEIKNTKIKLKQLKQIFKSSKSKVLCNIPESNENNQHVSIKDLTPHFDDLPVKTLITRKRKRARSSMTKNRMIEMYSATIHEIYPKTSDDPEHDRIDKAKAHIDTMFNKYEEIKPAEYNVEFDLK
jgi:hypothetical protein